MLEWPYYFSFSYHFLSLKIVPNSVNQCNVVFITEFFFKPRTLNLFRISKNRIDFLGFLVKNIKSTDYFSAGQVKKS
jgi:hypothetical protein